MKQDGRRRWLRRWASGVFGISVAVREAHRPVSGLQICLKAIELGTLTGRSVPIEPVLAAKACAAFGAPDDWLKGCVHGGVVRSGGNTRCVERSRVSTGREHVGGSFVLGRRQLKGWQQQTADGGLRAMGARWRARCESTTPKST